jgi:hypothetical protein
MDLLTSKKGFDPITLDEFNIQEWLDIDNDNIVFCIIDQNTKNVSNVFLLKKSYFISPLDNIVFKKCILNNNQLNIESTNKLKQTYINIGFFMNKSFIINYSNFVKTLNTSGSRIFKLVKNDMADSFINVKEMKMAHLALYKRNSNEYYERRNLPHSMDIYFDESTHTALRNYSYQWDQAINKYLIQGETYFKNSDFTKYYKRYGEEKDIAIQQVKDKIKYIDNAFLETAPRANKKIILWRGMQNEFRINERKAFVKPEYMNKIGDVSIAKNYTSVSKLKIEAENFMKPNCCLYKIILEKGMPHIDMKGTTKFKREQEVLLPRNIKFTLVDKIVVDKRPVFVVNVSFLNDEQFKTPTGCMKFKEVKITPLKINILKPSKDKKATRVKNTTLKTKGKQNKTVKAENNKMNTLETHIDLVVDTDNSVKQPIGPELPSQIHKLKRCLNGTRRNKKTGECEKIAPTNPSVTIKPQSPSIPVRKTKSGVNRHRCPNGTRKNKKTGKCE